MQNTPPRLPPQAPTAIRESNDGELTTLQTQLPQDTTHQGDCQKLSATSASVKNQADNKTQPLPVDVISIKPKSHGGTQARAINLGSDSPQRERGLCGAQVKPQIPGGVNLSLTMVTMASAGLLWAFRHIISHDGLGLMETCPLGRVGGGGWVVSQ